MRRPGDAARWPGRVSLLPAGCLRGPGQRKRGGRPGAWGWCDVPGGGVRAGAGSARGRGPGVASAEDVTSAEDLAGDGRSDLQRYFRAGGGSGACGETFGQLRRAARLTRARTGPPVPPGRHTPKLWQNGCRTATRRKLILFWSDDIAGQSFSASSFCCRSGPCGGSTKIIRCRQGGWCPRRSGGPEPGRAVGWRELPKRLRAAPRWPAASVPTPRRRSR